VLFVDFVGFSETVERVDAQALVDELHYYFANFDDVIKKYNLEKIKTIGDAYMCAGGLDTNSEKIDIIKEAEATVEAALELAEFMVDYKTERIAMDEFYFDCRIGIHTGPVVAGVVGKSKFAFDIWGQTVNIAKETEAASLPGKVTISETTYNLVKDAFVCTSRGAVTIKHNRMVQMYFVEGKKNSSN
jgi:adenylate cyclase